MKVKSLFVWSLSFSLLFSPLLAAEPSQQEMPDEEEIEESDEPQESSDEGDEPQESSEDDEEDSFDEIDPSEQVVGEVREYRDSLRVTTTARAPMEEFATDRSVDVIEEEAILERNAQSIADAIGEEAGAYRQSTNRGADTVYLRGLIGPENLILVDGVRFNQATFRTGPNQYLATLDPMALRRAEIVRGPGSVLYGSGAMGGVLQVFPREISDQPFAGRGVLTYGSADNTLGAALDGSMHRQGFGASLGASYRNHGPLRVGSRGGEDLFLAAEENGRMLGSEYQQGFWRGGAAVELNDDLDFTLNYMGGFIDRGKRTDQLGRGQMRSTDNRDDLLWARLTSRGLGFAEEGTAFVAYHRSDELTRRFQCFEEDSLADCASLRDEVLQSRRETRDVTTTLGTGIGAYSFLFSDLQLSYGAELYHDQVLSSRRDAGVVGTDWVPAARGNFSNRSTYTTIGAYTHGDYPLWDQGIQEIALNGGLRVEHFSAFAPGSDILGDIEFGNTGLVGALGVSYLRGNHLNLYLNWSQGFRAPNLQEATVLGDTGNFFEIPNPDLGPERADTFELGTKIDVPGVLRLSANVFTSLLSNRITGVPGTFDGQDEIDGKPVQIRINADRAYFYGTELSVKTTSLFGVRLSGNLAYIDGAVERETVDPDFQAGPLHNLFAGDRNWTNTRRLAPLQFLAALTYRYEELFSATLFVQGAGAQTRLSGGDRSDLRICEVAPGVLASQVDQPCDGTPGWATLNLRSSYHFSDWGTMNLSVTNILDQRYQYHGSGLFGPGLQALGTLVVRY